MYVERLVLGPLQTNCWLIGRTAEANIAVIDPADDADRVIRAIGGRAVDAIILTHCHFDHLGAVPGLLETTGSPLMVHEDDAEYLTTPQGTGGILFGYNDHVAPPADRLLAEGDVLEVAGVHVEVLHTPGHTPGGICLYVPGEDGAPGHLFSGDTIFAASVGRSDFPRGDARALQRSIAEKLAPLPVDTVVHPGHGPDTTIGREAVVNPFWPRT